MPTMKQPQQPYDTHRAAEDSRAVEKKAEKDSARKPVAAEAVKTSKVSDPLEKDRHEKTHGDVSIGTSG